MGITPASLASYVAQSLLQQIEANPNGANQLAQSLFQDIGATGQQDAPAQDCAADTSAPDIADPAAAMAYLRKLLADPSIAAQLMPAPTQNAAQQWLAQNPGASAQDIINWGYANGGNTYAGAGQFLKQFGIDINQLVANRQASASGIVNGGGSGVSGGGTVNGPAPVNQAAPGAPSNGSGAAGIAESFLGRNASELKGSGELPMNPDVPNDVCCANFVSGVLQKAGLLSPGEHTDGVSALKTTLENKGWKSVNLADAKPGDVVIVGGDEHHTEIVAKNENGKITLVGSNNRNADGSQCVSYDDYTANHESCLILTPP